jgi:hypothetical protein
MHNPDGPDTEANNEENTTKEKTNKGEKTLLFYRCGPGETMADSRPAGRRDGRKSASIRIARRRRRSATNKRHHPG